MRSELREAKPLRYCCAINDRTMREPREFTLDLTKQFFGITKRGN
jgi:hypothetical protein